MSETFISPDAYIHESAHIGSNVHILGRAIVGENCYIDDNVVIGHPSKDALLQMLRSSTGHHAGISIEKYSDGITRLGNNCCIRYGSVIAVGSALANNVYCDIRTQIGAYCKIGNDSQILYGAKIYNDVIIGAHCRIGGFCCNRSVIEDNVSMFGEMVHSYRQPVGGLIEPSPTVRNGATVGWRAVLIGEVIVGFRSYVAAGAIVTKNISSDHIALGHGGLVIPLASWKGRLSGQKKGD